MKRDHIDGRAEMLAAMNCLMHHLADADDLEQWMTQAFGEKLDWHLLDAGVSERKAAYTEMARKMDGNEFECVIHTFASIVAGQCFNNVYRPGAFASMSGAEQKEPDDGETGSCATCAHCDGMDDMRDICRCRLGNPHADWRFNNNEPCPDWWKREAFK